MNPRQISIEAFDYPLAQGRIALYPLPERDASKLLIYQDGQISEDSYRNLAEHLPAGRVLVLNNTRVLEARLLFRKPTGGVIEIFILEPAADQQDISSTLSATRSVQVKCLVGGAGKWKRGYVPVLTLPGAEPLELKARIADRLQDAFLIDLSWQPESLNFAEVLHRAGQIPLPPYLGRGAETSDRDRYQTIYAGPEGSVAAPTAGLHFTPAVFSALEKKGIGKLFLTLHVGAGTFKPVHAATMADHLMHSECIDIPADLPEQLVGQHLYAVGTTALRTLETLYLMGCKAALHPSAPLQSLQIEQWDAYDFPAAHWLPRDQALMTLAERIRQQGLERLITRTSLMIAPGYQFRVAEGLITNFHQPRSTLLLLIAAILGDEWKTLYDYALGHDFRFLSYGDGCLIHFPAEVKAP